MKTVRIKADSGAAVNVVMDYVDGDDEAAIAVALECINSNPTYKEEGDIYHDVKLTQLVGEHSERNYYDRVTDGASSGYRIQVAGYSVLWHSGISEDLCLTIAPEGTTIEDWVRSWDDNGREYADSWGFGWGSESDVVGEDHWREVVIQIHSNRPHLLKDDDGNVIIFDDFQAAKAWVDDNYGLGESKIMDAGIIY